MANDRISDLTTASTLTGAELFEVSQPSGGSPAYNSRKALLSAINAYIKANLSSSGGGMGPPGLDGLDGDDLLMIPGPQGIQGPQGVPGTGGSGGGGIGPPGLDGADPDDPMMIPGPAGTSSGSSSGNTYYQVGNTTPDTHPNTPTVRDDEFEGSTLSSAWTVLNAGNTSSISVNSGLLQVACLSSGTVNVNTVIYKAITGTSFDIRCKLNTVWGSGGGNDPFMGLWIGNSSQGVGLGLFANASRFYFQGGAGSSTGGGNYFGPVTVPNQPSSNILPVYLRIVYNSPNATCYASYDGVSWYQLSSAVNVVTGNLGSDPTRVGLFFGGQHDVSAVSPIDGAFDWFRDYTAGYTPSSLTTLPTSFVGGNINFDTPVANANAGNDEFNATLNTAWTWFNQGAATVTTEQGYLIAQGDAATILNLYVQPVPSGTTWAIQSGRMSRAKASTGGGGIYGICVYNSSTNKTALLGVWDNGATTVGVIYWNGTSATSFAYTGSNGAINEPTNPYFRIYFDGTNLNYQYSPTAAPNSWTTLLQATPSTGVGGSVTHVGFALNEGSVQNPLITDWFRIGVGPFQAQAPSLSTATGNTTPDTHPSTPTAYDDEFEVGSTVDTTGSRFSGANAWTIVNSASASLSQGSLIIAAPADGGSSRVARAIEQPVPSGAWSFRAKIRGTLNGNYNIAGMWLRNASTAAYWGMLHNAAFANPYLGTQNWPTYSTQSDVYYPTALNYGQANPVSNESNAIYVQISYDGSSTLSFATSSSGVAGSFVTAYTTTASVLLGGAPTNIGLCALSISASVAANLICDWFRRIS